MWENKKNQMVIWLKKQPYSIESVVKEFHKAPKYLHTTVLVSKAIIIYPLKYDEKPITISH